MAKFGEYEVENPEIQDILRILGRIVGKQLPRGWGFTLQIFNFGGYKDSASFYISNANRQDVLKQMQEFIDKNKES